MAPPRLARLALPLLAALAVTACRDQDRRSSGLGVTPTPPTPMILEFTAAPARVTVGAPVTLSWRTKDVVSLVLTDDRGTTIPLGDAGLEQGSVEVLPTGTTTYTLAAGGAGVAGPARRSLTVRPIPVPPDPPVVEEFRASAERVPAGGEVKLSWRTTGATTLTLKDDAGHAYEPDEGSIDEGAVRVHPVRTTTYFLTATGPGGRDEAAETVGVIGAPRIARFYVDPLVPVPVGDRVTLHWETIHADDVVLTRDDGAPVAGDLAPDGSLAVTLTDNVRFELEATGPGGAAHASVLARVRPRIRAFTSSARVVRPGDSVALSWVLADADRAWIEGPDGFRLPLADDDLAAGTATVDVPTGGDFQLRAFREDVGETASLWIGLTQAPRIRSFTVDRAVTTASTDRPAAATFSWVQDGGTTCSLSRDGAPLPGYGDFPCDRTGSVSLPVTESQSVRLIARNADGSDQASVDVLAFPPARVIAFTSSPNRRLTPGTRVELSWTVIDAVAVSLEKDGVPLCVAPGELVGSASDRVDFDSVYVLEARNSLGTPTVATLQVRAGNPVILSVRARPAFASIGAPVTLAWTVDGGETLTLTDPQGTELVQRTDPAGIDEGSTVVLAPLVAGTYGYTLTVANGAGASDTEIVPLEVGDGPMIRSFDADRARLSLGETVTLSWAVDDDPAGNPPTLALADDLGRTYDLAGLDPHQGSVAITPGEEGPRLFTLAASSTPERTVATATLPVDVTTPPFADSFTPTPETIRSQDATPVVLAWQSRNAVEVSIWESDAAGHVVAPAVHRVSRADHPQAELDQGSFTVRPAATTHYVLRVANRVGSLAELHAKVVVDPPEVLSFAATPAEVVAGEDVLLTWSTRNANGAAIDPVPVHRVRNNFLDLSPSGTGTGTPGGPIGDTALATIPFPAGFAFPFDGLDRTSIQVSTNGWAGFDTANPLNPTSPGQLPNDAYRYANFAVFAGDLASDQGVVPGTLYSGLARDALGDMFVIEWKNWSWWSSSYDLSDLNFELVLRPDGNFEYRYGTLQANSSSTSPRANGVGVALGFQTPGSGGAGMTVVANGTRVPGGLPNSGFAFPLAIPTSGALATTPFESRTFTLSASNADATVTRDVPVKVWKVPAIASAGTLPVAPQATVPFEIQWTVAEATQVRVLDGAGAEICRITDAARIASGSCTHTDPSPGPKTYAIEATNGPARNVVTQSFPVTVFPLLSLDSFTVSPGTFVTHGDTVTVAWSARGAADLVLEACTPNTGRTACVDVTPAGANPNGGSYTQTMTRSVEFYLQIFDQATRRRAATQSVWVDAATVDTLAASATQIPAGAATTLTWTTTGASAVWIPGLPPPAPVEVTASAPYLDLSTTGTPANLLPGGTADHGHFELAFPDGFAFPWFGSPMTGVHVSTDGWLTFDTNYTGELATEQSLPTSSAYRAVQLAPFWDDLEQGPEPLRWQLGQTVDGVRFLAIEWRSWSFQATSGRPSNLNFEVLLFETGDVEFRYGGMACPAGTASNLAGDSAAMGWQGPDRAVGGMLAGAAGSVVPGGLANRSWRFAFGLPPNASLVVMPSESTTYRVCATSGGLHVDCREVRVVVVKPGDVLITELMIAPPASTAEWFEVRNVSPDPIDLAGWTATSGASESFAIPAAPPLVVPPGGFAVFARSATANGGLVPDVVYGNALGLENVADELRLFFSGTAIDGVGWGDGWTIPSGRSLGLEPSAMARSSGANDAPIAWCPTTAVYGDGTLGGSPGALGAGCLAGGANDHYLVDPVTARPFLDIRATGLDDSAYLQTTYFTGPIPLGFAMPFFDGLVDTLQISRNGFLAFVPFSGEYPANAGLPTAGAPDGVVAPFWDDGVFTAGVAALHHQRRTQDGQQVMIVQWDDLSFGAASYGTVTFQAQLWENGDIVFAYRDLTVLDASYTYVRGSSATIGLENLAGTDGLELFYGTSGTAGGPVFEGRAIHLIRR